MGDYIKCMRYYREALRIKKDTISQEPSYVQAAFAEVLQDIAVIQASRDPTKSIQAYHLCLEIRRNCLSSEDPLLGITFCNLASVYFSIGMGSEALDHLLQAQMLLGDREDVHSFDVWVAIGAAQRQLGSAEDSISSFEEAHRVLDRIRATNRRLDVVSKMAQLTRSRGNTLSTPEELNEAVSFFTSNNDDEEEREAGRVTIAPTA
jgi:tetratricopeptide (TPR) repeat protein